MPELGVPKFKATAIRDTVADALRRSLLEGRFQPGENLSEVAIASEFQISRGPVREAMLVLAGEGLLTHTQNRGFSVLHFTARDLEQVERVRLSLESLALAASREHVTGRDLERLVTLKDPIVAAFDVGDGVARVRAEVEFHTAIWALSGDPWLWPPETRDDPEFQLRDGVPHEPPRPHGRDPRRLHSLYIDYLRGTSDRTAEECVRIHIAGIIDR
ncbi:MAG: GntR family transcriptional regulator [Singulisphaera sp.]